jgi:hypothetical protein
LKTLPPLGAEKLAEWNHDILSLTLRFFEKGIQDHRFLVVSFLHYKMRWGILGNFSKVVISFVSSSVGMTVLEESPTDIYPCTWNGKVSSRNKDREEEKKQQYGYRNSGWDSECGVE